MGLASRLFRPTDFLVSRLVLSSKILSRFTIILKINVITILVFSRFVSSTFSIIANNQEFFRDPSRKRSVSELRGTVNSCWCYQHNAFGLVILLEVAGNHEFPRTSNFPQNQVFRETLQLVRVNRNPRIWLFAVRHWHNEEGLFPRHRRWKIKSSSRLEIIDLKLKNDPSLTVWDMLTSMWVCGASLLITIDTDLTQHYSLTQANTIFLADILNYRPVLFIFCLELISCHIYAHDWPVLSTVTW